MTADLEILRMENIWRDAMRSGDAQVAADMAASIWALSGFYMPERDELPAILREQNA